MSEFLMKPKIDFAFKEIMTDEKARIGFLSAMLKICPDDIRETMLLETNLRKTYADDKLGVLDVRVLMNDNTEIDIEVQLSRLTVWAERSLFYLSKMYVDQIGPGGDYSTFKRCVSISILDFRLLDDSNDFYSCFHIAEDTRHTLLTDKMEFHVVELPKLPKELKEDSSDILLWAKFINAERKEEFDMIAEKNAYIDSAYQKLQIISQDRQKRLEYEAREKAVRDHNQFILEAENRGIAQGIEKGMVQGIEKGVAQGIEKGMAQGIEKGMAQGIEKGIAQGIEKGMEKGVAAMFALLMDISTPYQEAISVIAEKFSLPKSRVEEITEKYK